MRRKPLLWTMLCVLLVLALYLRGASDISMSNVSGAASASKVTQKEQQPRLATRTAWTPTLQFIDQADVWEQVEAVAVEPSGAIGGQTVQEDIPLDLSAATGLLAASEAVSIEHAEVSEAEQVNVEPSGAITGQAAQEEFPLDLSAYQAATGIVSQ